MSRKGYDIRNDSMVVESFSDGQRFRLRRKILQRTYSHRFRDYALDADNYAPFYSTVIECTDRDAAYVLAGLLYNESDLALEEHYTDTHGYTEINFAAFAMLGRRFAPRIRGLQHQRIYRIDKEKSMGHWQHWSNVGTALFTSTVYASSCLTLIMACIIYWQAQEISQVILEGEPEAAGVNLSLLEHISPIGWENIILYRQYVLNRSLVKP